jgi:hypothetical protein
VTQTRDGLRLGSVIYDGTWEPGTAASARCRRDEDPFAVHIGAHETPAAECMCGFHAARDPVDAFSYLRGRDEPATVARVLGEVELFGTIVETDAGWRAARAYPARLYVDDPVLAAALAAYGVPVCGSPSSRTCTETRLRSAQRSQMSSIATST